ncbi:MAG: MauE/DoxX family redox-associated membrane protein, partial [Verrucomicrobiota bacterium]
LPFSLGSWMHDWMGLFLVVFAMLKLFDLPGFVRGFARYDLLAGKVRGYGFVYPFIELVLGLAFLAHWNPVVVYAATIIVFGFGAVGVFVALSRGLDANCACLGTSLNVPLSSVAVVEDLGMVVMSVVMLVMVM